MGLLLLDFWELITCRVGQLPCGAALEWPGRADGVGATRSRRRGQGKMSVMERYH
jgi:hypothetical protein